MPIGY
ncbi:f582d46f-0fea-4357-9168-dd9ff1f38c4b [Thermothielavioides terrestris]